MTWSTPQLIHHKGDWLTTLHQSVIRISTVYAHSNIPSVSAAPFHLCRYLDEQTFCYDNCKKLDNAGRFSLAISKIVGKRLTFAELTGKVGVVEAF